MASFVCDNCNHTRPTSDGHVGKSAKCPKCGGRGNVTADSDMSPVDASSDDYLPPQPVVAAPALPETPPETAHLQPASPTQTPQTAMPTPEVLKLPKWASIVIRLSYLLLGMFTLGALALFVLSIGNATGAPQEAAAGAIFSSLFIAAYILARCIEKMVRATVGM